MIYIYFSSSLYNAPQSSLYPTINSVYFTQKLELSELQRYWGCKKAVYPLERHIAGTAILSKNKEAEEALSKGIASVTNKSKFIKQDYVALTLPPSEPVIDQMSGIIRGPVVSGSEDVRFIDFDDLLSNFFIPFLCIFAPAALWFIIPQTILSFSLDSIDDYETTFS